MDTEGLLEGLTDSQRHAVTVEAAPLCVVAGAGSGKTRVLTRRIAWRIASGSAEPSHVLAVTFTRKAAGELRARLGSLGVRGGVAAGTFHSLAYASLRQLWCDNDRRPPALLDRKASLLGRILPARLRPRGPAGSSSAATMLADLATEIEWAKARLLQPQDYAAAAVRSGRRLSLLPSDVAEVYATYEEEKRRRRVVDFDDLLLEAALAMEGDAGFAAAQRWRVRHLFVDEVQDANPAQWRLIAAWLGDRLDLCVVGDPNQAIYSWNGAEPGLLEQMAQRMPSTLVVRLEENWRSTPQILSVAGALLSQADSRPGISGALPKATRCDGAVPSVDAYPDDRAEAAAVARRVRQAHAGGHPWSAIAVLARTNAQLLAMAEALGGAAVPFRLPESGSLLAQPEVRSALDLLQRDSQGRAPASWVKDLEELAEEAHGGAVSGGGAQDRRYHLQALARLALEYGAVDPLGTPAGFAGWLSAIGVAGSGTSQGEGIELATFHRAKGLEWEVVFLVGMEQGLVPIAASLSNPAAEAEERRLVYVAITRARDELHCSWARRRTLSSSSVSAHRRPSPYLEAMQAAMRALDCGVSAPEQAITQIRAGRQRLGLAGGRVGARLGEADQELVGELRAWRAEAARSTGVPAHVIMHDSTLSALASRRPRSPDDLLAVPGLGPVKVSRYGASLLEVMRRAS